MLEVSELARRSTKNAVDTSLAFGKAANGIVQDIV